MKGKKKKPEWENLKLPTALLDRLREHKKKTLVPISQAATKAITDYLDGQKP